MKHIVYKYDDHRSDDLDFDPKGSLTFTIGDIVSKRRMRWRIVGVDKEEYLGIVAIPTYWVYLARIVAN